MSRSIAVVAPVLTGLIAAVVAGSALAQTAPPLVGSGRADQNPPAVRAFPQPAPTEAPARDANAPISPFLLQRVVVKGSSLPPETVAAAYAAFVGQTMDNPALTRITAAVAAAYPRTDIALYTVLVPRQSFAEGVLRLVVVEGYVQDVRLEGVRGAGLRRLLSRYLAPVVRERPLRRSTFQRALSRVRDVPGLGLEAKLERGARQGAVRLVLTVDQHPVQAAFGISDRGTALLGRDQVQLDGYLNGLVLAGDQIHATVLTPTDPTLFQFYGLTYAAPFNGTGGVAQASVSYLRTRPQRLPLQGDAVSFGVQASQPVIRSFDTNLYLTASLTGVNSDNALLGFTLSNERTRTLRLAAAYSRSGARNLFTVSATGSLGVDGLGARRDVNGLSEPDFKKLNLKLIDNVSLAGGFVLRLDSFAQLTDDRLPASEEVALGGDEFGRAYEAAIIAGDYGVAGSAELAWRPARHVPKALAGSELYGFVDGGRVWSHSRDTLGATRSDLASLGGGFRAQLRQRAVLQVEAVRGLTNPVLYENREVWRLLFSLRSAF